MSRPAARLACTRSALAILAAALACLGACAPSRPVSTPAPTATVAAATPTAPLAAATPTASPVPATRTPSAAPTASEVPYVPTDFSTPTASATTRPSATATATPRPANATRVPPLATRGTPAADAGFLLYAGAGRDRTIWLSQGESARIVSPADWFWVADDGRTIAYARGFPDELWIADAVGLNARLLYTAPMGSPLINWLHWSPDGSTIAFDLSCPGCPQSQDPGELWAVDVATGEVRKLVDSGAHGPVFSPDSRWLALIAANWLSPQYGPVGLFDLVEGRGRPTFSGFISVVGLEWAADSSGFVVAFVTDWNAAPIVAELWWVPTNGSRRKLGHLENVWDVYWQPGGGRMVYQKEEPGGVSRLFLAGRDGSDELLIPDSEEMVLGRGVFPAWSPGGRWLLTMRENGTYYLVDTETLAVHPLDVTGLYGWVHSDEYLAFIIPDERLADFREGEDVPWPVYLCAPLEACTWLGDVPRGAEVAYVRP